MPNSLTNPATTGSNNVGFDNYAKEFGLRIEAMKVAGQYAKDIAEAALTTTKAKTNVERNKVLEMSRHYLRGTLARLETLQRTYEHDLKEADRNFHVLGLVVVGTAPTALTTLYQRFNAVKWILQTASFHPAPDQPLQAIEFQFAKVPLSAQQPENFLSLLQTPKTIIVEENLNALRWIDECRRLAIWWKAGSPAHEWVVGYLMQLCNIRAGYSDYLQKALDSARTGQYNSLHEMLPFLQLPSA